MRGVGGGRVPQRLDDFYCFFHKKYAVISILWSKFLLKKHV